MNISLKSKMLSIPVGKSDDDFWAKTDRKTGIVTQNTKTHSLLVGCAFDLLKKELNLQDVLPVDATTLAAAHDNGKISPGFNLKIPLTRSLHNIINNDWERALCTNHAETSETTLNYFLAKKYNQALPPNTSFDVSKILGAHHGRRDFPSARADSSKYGGGEWLGARMRFIEDMEKEFGPLLF